jgi:hypothetical protein
MGICLSNQMSFGNNNNNRHDGYHRTAINQNNCHIGLGETITPNHIQNSAFICRLASNQRLISTLSI